MKVLKKLGLLLVGVLFTFTAYPNAAANRKELMNLIGLNKTVLAIPDTLIGAKAAKADSSLTLEEMLTYAIQDEYLAKAKYELVISKFGAQRPFSNIIKAEINHIEALKPLLNKYKVNIPTEDMSAYLKSPTSVRESIEAGVQGEIENIAMYDRFMNEKIPEDVRVVFRRLQDASKNHLKAFQRALNR